MLLPTQLLTLPDLHIYMAGVGVQQLFILIFLAFAVGFHRVIRMEETLDATTRIRALRLLTVLYVCVALISVRFSLKER